MYIFHGLLRQLSTVTNHLIIVKWCYYTEIRDEHKFKVRNNEDGGNVNCPLRSFEVRSN